MSAVHQTGKKSIQQQLDDHLTVIRHLQKLADTLPQTDRLAMQRRVHQLTMDHIYNTIMLTRSEQKLDETIEALRQNALYPLPDRDYSTKYVWFRKMTNSRLGRRILLRTLPKMKKER